MANFLAMLQELVAAGQMRRERSWPPRDALRKGDSVKIMPLRNRIDDRCVQNNGFVEYEMLNDVG